MTTRTRKQAKTVKAWAAMWRSDNKLDGQRAHIIMDPVGIPMIGRTRKEMRDYVDTKYGYLRTRTDLAAEPHGWKMPIVVRVEIRIIKQ